MSFDIEAWQAIAAGAALVVVKVHDMWAARKTRKTAEKAVELSAPTGNGFAGRVTASLIRIEAAQARTEQKLDHHLQAHADADVHNRPRRILKDVNEL